MKKDIFKLRHAALVAALALVMGAPLSFADEEPVDPGTDIVAVTGADGGVGIVVGDGALGDPAEPIVEDTPVIDPPALPVDGEDVVLNDPIPVELVDPMPEESAPVEGVDVVTEEVPMDDCGVICQNVAGELPPEAVYKNDDVPAEVLQFSGNGESPAASLDVSAELSGAIGAVEQLGAADVAVGDGSALAVPAPAAVVANAANGDSVTVIRNGHLR